MCFLGVEYSRVRMDEDLCQLPGPITHESVLKILKQRYFDQKYHVSFFAQV